MKIVAFTDLHGSESKFDKLETLVKKEKPEYVICCGDMTVFENEIEKILKRMNSWGFPVLIIHGNHEEAAIVEYYTNKLDNLIFLHKNAHRDNKVLFLGYGGGGFAEYDPKFEDTVEDWEELMEKEDTLILITHQPPYKGADLVLDGEHAGSKSIARFIKKYKPKYCFCGHLHENFSKEEELKKTLVVNPGPEGKVFEI